MTPRRKVAVILQLWQNFDRGILQGIASYVREGHDWSVFVEEVEHQRIPDFKAWDGDGLIVNFDNPHVVRALRGVDKPIIAVGGGGGWHNPASGIPYVATDDETIGRLAAGHLMDCGLRNFAFCGYPKNRTNLWMMNRKHGFTQRLAEAGFACHSFHGRHTTATHWHDVLAELSAWLRRLPLPVGIMGCYDYRARHVLEACKSLGLRVPDDVALIGVDNDIICELADPPLSSIEQGRFRIGYTAAATLELMMSGKRRVPKRQTIDPVGLVPRQSTDILCVADPALATALRMIREHACQGIQADTVAERIGLSRNTLDKRCKEHIGRTIDLEIRRLRLECAKDLLARTTLPLREVARKAGFGSEQYLSSVFSKTIGCRPSQYRIDHRESRLIPSV
jgi:LacI family transcriptional regulator